MLYVDEVIGSRWPERRTAWSPQKVVKRLRTYRQSVFRKSDKSRNTVNSKQAIDWELITWLSLEYCQSTVALTSALLLLHGSHAFVLCFMFVVWLNSLHAGSNENTSWTSEMQNEIAALLEIQVLKRFFLKGWDSAHNHLSRIFYERKSSSRIVGILEI